MTVVEQRTTLAASLTDTSGWVVHSFPIPDFVPPCVIIGNPTYNVVSRIATVTWPISLINTRSTAESITTDFDDKLEVIMRALAKGLGINFVVSEAGPRTGTQEIPVDLPEYIILGTTTIPFC